MENDVQGEYREITVAAIMGHAPLLGVMKKGASLENNINQTIASGINTAGTGIVFTLPALFMLNYQWVKSGDQFCIYSGNMRNAFKCKM